MRVGIFLAALLLLATLVFTACTQDEEAPPSTTPTPTPSSSSVAEEFLGLWQEGSYSEMYNLLASSAQAEINRQDFVARYQAITEEATISGVSYLFQPSPDPEASELPFSVTISTAFFGDIAQINTMELVKEGQGSQERWRILWSPSLIFRDLTGASLVHFFTDVPQRGAIYDRHGTPLALDGRVQVWGRCQG